MPPPKTFGGAMYTLPQPWKGHGRAMSPRPAFVVSVKEKVRRQEGPIDWSSSASFMNKAPPWMPARRSLRYLLQHRGGAKQCVLLDQKQKSFEIAGCSEESTSTPAGRLLPVAYDSEA